jgi:hypothetical protein
MRIPDYYGRKLFDLLALEVIGYVRGFAKEAFKSYSKPSGTFARHY